ncbi:MAG: hypothetical protein IKM20_04635 [Erysipelotrichales bacterium]|nr:hypothetical protein [Erysipelotrichales bacterium]
MRKLRVFMIIMLLIFTSACSNRKVSLAEEKQPNGIIEGIVLEVFDSSFLMIDNESHNQYIVSYDYNELLTNQLVKVTYDGMIQETYPMGITASEISTSSTLLTMYLNVLDELQDKDAALNNNVKIVSLDIDDTLGLTDNEKQLLANTVALRYGAEEILFMNYQELCDGGYIDTEDIHFDSGLLISLKGNEENNSFEFNVAKYKGGLAAYFMSCKAMNNNGIWSYKVISEAIS